MYRGENAVNEFMEKMLEEVEYCKGIIKKRFNKPLIMTENDKLRFKQMDVIFVVIDILTKTCMLETIVTLQENSGGSAHQECNLRLRITPESIKIAVVFHNLHNRATDW